MSKLDLTTVGTKKVLPAPQPTKKDMELLTESKSRELIANQPFVEIVRQIADAEWDGKPLTEDMVYHMKRLANLKVAIIRDNRRTYRRTIKMLKACMSNGMTTPGILVSAKIIFGWGLTLIDPTSGRELTAEEVKDWYAVMEGHARLDAWILSILYASMTGGEPFDFHFVYKDYATPEDFGKAYVSTNTDMTRTTNKDRLSIAGARSQNPIVMLYLSKIKNDHVIPKASSYWTTGHELSATEVSKLIYGENDAPTFDKALTEGLALCYESFKERFSAEGAEKIYRGVSAAQWCADQLLNKAEDIAKTAYEIGERVVAMTDELYTPIITAKTNKKKHITRDQAIKTYLDLMMNK